MFTVASGHLSKLFGGPIYWTDIWKARSIRSRCSGARSIEPFAGGRWQLGCMRAQG
jgi:hypothetical protein